jgi:probable rRNA maturation factor
MKHKINVLFEKKGVRRVTMGPHLRRCITAALDAEGVDVPCEVNVLVTDDETIRMFTFRPGAFPPDAAKDADPETGLLPLGDMVISAEHAERQAEEYGHSLKREMGYLAIHSVLHMLGYDHLDEGPMKRQMRAREEKILADVVLPR